jgi:uncharacterized protein YndB with AHSA1/START domain
MNATKITVETWVNAPVDTVWSCWTEPDHITQWNFASDDWCCPSVSQNLTVGGVYSARMEAKDGSFGFDFRAVYGEVDPNSAITLNMDDGRVARTTFAAVDAGTRITTVFDAETTHSIEMQRGGWQAILDNFKKHVETI